MFINPPKHFVSFSSSSVDQPLLIQKYNANMGGVDRMDQNVGTYRISIRSKKMVVASVCFFLDVSINNAWLLYRKSPAHRVKPLDQLGFKRDLALAYVKYFQSKLSVEKLQKPQSIKRKHVPEAVRKNSSGHQLEPIPKQRRCRLCGGKAKYICPACDEPLHMYCSAGFHA